MDGNSDSGKSISIDWDTDDEIEIESTPLSSGLGLAAADQEAFAECGETRLAGSYVKSFQFDYSESYRRTIDKGKQKIYELAVSLRIEDGGATNLADKFYKIAVERSFTKGRRTEQVVAACLYIACRYVLGAVFLQLCQLLSLQEHDIVQKAVDPSLFIDRYTNALVGENMKVSKTALLIIASMKRDWMQTGRKPSGLCGAAVYISALSHGIKCSKSDIGRIVHVCEATLTKRLIEFENTDSGSLTIEEFIKNADVLKKEDHLSKLSDANYRNSETTEVLCQHKDQKPHFAGLCKSCCQEFIELSGGLHGGADPPAFQIAERERLAEASSEKVTDSANLSISAIWKAGGSAPPWRPPKSSMNYKHQSKCDGRTESIWRVPSSAQTAAEATRQMLTKKGLSSKINYDVLDKLFDDQHVHDAKRTRKESRCASDIDDQQQFSKEQNGLYTQAPIQEHVLRCHQDSHYALDHLLCSVWEAMDRL